MGMLPVFISALVFIGCGDDKEDNTPEETDSGIVIVTDGGVKDDAGGLEDDSGVIEDDAGIIEDDAGIPEDDAGIDTPDAGPIEDNGFIRIPAGSFTLSHETAEHAANDTVTVAAFELGKTPVTVAEFKKCVEAGNCTSDHYEAVSDGPDCNYDRGDAWLNHPMNCVDWSGAKEYCEWIGGRLPTEEEWEYAATHNGREHLNTMYPWGDDSPTNSLANYNNNVGSTTEVGHYSPAGDSPLGLVDMSGNVFEWTSSSVSLGSSSIVIKGGTWDNDEDFLRVTVRTYDSPSYKRDGDVGFRCAK